MNNGFLFREVGYTPTFLAERYGVTLRAANYWYNNIKQPADSSVIDDAIAAHLANRLKAMDYFEPIYEVDIRNPQDVAFAVVLKTLKPDVEII